MTCLLAFAALLFQGGTDLRERWVYYPLDLREEKNVAKLHDLMKRATRLGYNAVVLEDPNFAMLPLQGRDYFETLRRIRDDAEALGMGIVPAVFQIGHSQDLLAQNPNLAEGVPVEGALYVVEGGVARLTADPPVRFRETWDFRDPTVSADWRVVDPRGKLARISQTLRVHPFRQYHLSVRFRTRDFKGRPRLIAIGGGRLLNYDLPGVKPTQDWTLHHAVFNSLDSEEVRIAIGAWDGETGELAMAEPQIEEVGLLNVLRREGAPLRVQTEGGRTLVEGRDFEPVVDPRLGVVPRRGRFEEWHPPPLLRTSLPDGERLRVFYYHPVTMPDNGQVMICPSEPETLKILRDQARRLHEIFHPKAFLMTHDEIRVLNWDDSCRRRGLDAGAIVADNVRHCTRILRELAPRAEIYVWSDMFNPVHNARANYCLVRGDLAGSWEGLDKDVIIAEWFFDRRDESLQWFWGLGHQTLLAAYYDQKPERARDWMESAGKGKGTIGIMYTSWYDRYDDLEGFTRSFKEPR